MPKKLAWKLLPATFLFFVTLSAIQADDGSEKTVRGLCAEADSIVAGHIMFTTGGSPVGFGASRYDIKCQVVAVIAGKAPGISPLIFQIGLPFPSPPPSYIKPGKDCIIFLTRQPKGFFPQWWVTYYKTIGNGVMPDSLQLRQTIRKVWPSHHKSNQMTMRPVKKISKTG